MKHPKRKLGFTLIELSIVLVVVGLLVGGLLVGQALIDTAKVNREIQLISQFDAAVNSFYTRYGQIPGDTNLFGSVRGNNNGIIESTLTGGGNYAYSGEVAKFWNDLTQADFTVDKLEIPDASDNSGFNNNDVLPNSRINEDSQFIAIGGGISWEGNRNFYISSQYTQVAGNPVNVQPVYIPVMALALDEKMDDGIAGQGSVTATDHSQLEDGFANGDSGSVNPLACVSLNGYNVSNSQDSCSMSFEIGNTLVNTN